MPTHNEPALAERDGRFSCLLKPTRRGMFTIPFHEYLSFPAVNNTLLNYFADCPLSAYEFLSGLVHEKPTRPMILGSAVDCLVCDLRLFDAMFHVRPETIEELPWHGNRTACKEWIERHSDRPILTREDVFEAQSIASAVLSDPMAAGLIEQCQTQPSVFWADKRTGLQMKGRIDFKGPRFAADLKVVSGAKTEELAKTIDRFRWHVQAAIYSDGLEAIGEECNTFYIIAVQSGERPKVNVRYYKSDAIEFGRAEYLSQLADLKACLQGGSWHGYSGASGEVGEIDLPRYAYQREELELVIGGRKVMA